MTGGRWSGVFDNYDPTNDPDNMETCFLCNGTGLRNDNIGKKAREKDPSFTCNGCNGKGKRIKWPSEWKEYSGDIASVSHVIKFVENSPGLFGYVTPDKEWIEKGSMGWFACISNKKDEELWKQESLDILKKYNNGDYVVVAVDFHI
jgi:hypothetical protein